MKTYISDANCITPLGFSVQENWEALRDNRSGVMSQEFSEQFPEICASVIQSKKLDEVFSQNFQDENFTRLEKMLLLSLDTLVKKNKISDKTLLILSTTKGNISLLKNQQHPPKGIYLTELAQKIADFYQFKTTPIVVCNACVSGVLSLAVAKNLLQGDTYSDAYIIAGDEVSDFVVSGFNSFQAMSAGPCKPYDKNRIGINLGEAAAAVYLSKNLPENGFCFEIMGNGSVNDANHISGPSRDGEGLYQSILSAMKEANISAEQIDFVSAHGTATVYNDEMESFAFSRAGLSEVPLNSLKGYYGHCLGAAGLLETIIAMESAKEGLLIKSLGYEENGVSQPITVIEENTSKNIAFILKTASGFGGCNAAVILKKIQK